MDGSHETGFRGRPVWLLGLLVVVVGQAGLALNAFGGWTVLRDARPVVAGRHPLHLYHAGLGADTFRQKYSTSCFDPSFQAGYPKTPVFDGACRPAEFVLYLAGAGSEAAAYKTGLFVLCLFVPLACAAAARGAGVRANGACLAATFGCGVWWSPPVRAAFDAGEIDQLLAGLCAVVFVAWLSRYNWEPGPVSWAMLALPALVGWYAQPVIWLGLTAIVATYYLAAAPRHGPAWHLGLVGVTFFGITPNMWWLWDWGRFWWLRQPAVDDVAPLPTWGAVLGSTADNLALVGHHPFGGPLMVAGLGACFLFFVRGQRTASAVLTLAGLLAVVVARLGETWSPFMAGGTTRAVPFAAALAVVPVAGLLATWAERAIIVRLVIALGIAAPLFLGWGGTDADPLRDILHLHVAPIPIGLTADQEEIVRGLTDHATAAGRILIEDGGSPRTGWNWTALLPTRTDRNFLGGLDGEASLEHAYCGLTATKLNGRRLEEWTDGELADFIRRYNVGWVLCRSPLIAARWERVPGAAVVGRYRDGGEVQLIALNRTPSFILLGNATWERADRRKIVLTDLVPVDAPNPDGGPVPVKVLTLSLHYQAGLRVSPNTVAIERDQDPYDPIPMVRLRMTGPLTRVVLSWDNR